MVDTRWLYTALLGVMVGERLLELRISQRNRKWLMARGAVEVGQGHYPWMVLLHGLFLLSCLVEVWWLDRPFIPLLALVSTVALVLSMALRHWVIATLGHRWTTRVFCLPGEPVVTSGPFRYLRHPNYLAVMVEIVALPLIHTAWMTAVLFSAANAWLLRHRIRSEEKGLRQFGCLDPGGSPDDP